MKRFTRTMVTSGLLGVVITLISSGVAEARIVVNHNETVLRVRH